MVKVLVIGQTPPPFGGQAIMIEMLLGGKYPNTKLFHVRLAFSKEMSDIGRIQFSKILHLILVIFKIIYFRFRHHISILYYPPAGPNKIPMYRDFIILILTRWLFHKTIFHFHAGGTSELYDKLSRITRLLFRLAYFNADAAIRLSELTPCDGKILKAKREFIVPNGITDFCKRFKRDNTEHATIPEILYVGVLKESKGILTLLEACDILASKGMDFTVKMVGKFESELFEDSVKQRVLELSLETRVTFPGVLTGEEKFKAFSKADIFCFPTFFESEAFPLVLLEAMQFALPVISTQWRGVPSIVQDGISGYLLPIKESLAIAEKLEKLINNPSLARKMGERGREIYLNNYTIDKHRERMANVFSLVAKKNVH